jgi:hypothetical protein
MDWEEGKQFFFEKKNQKTFAYFGPNFRRPFVMPAGRNR